MDELLFTTVFYENICSMSYIHNSWVSAYHNFTYLGNFYPYQQAPEVLGDSELVGGKMPWKEWGKTFLRKGEA